MRHVLLVLTFLSAFSIKAQEVYQTFLEEGKSWTYSCYEYEASYWKWHDFTMSISGDTVVNSRKCSKLYLKDHDNEVFFAAVYEQDRKVMYCLKGSTDEKLWYDFSLGIGGTLKWVEEMPYVDGLQYLNKIDTIEVGGRYFRRMSFYTKKWDEYPIMSRRIVGEDLWAWFICNQVVEGVGSLHLIENSYRGIDGLPETYSQVKLKSCQVNGQLLFDADAFYSPAITTQIRDMRLKPVGKPNDIYNLSGQCMPSAPRKGVYIRNGKKYVVK